ncbi:MAG: hypothetical protein IPK13_13510 [Deltaproteobacteria bacterium]|nr:hypothetical protein [Deltaproteobacteria bacterium]
MSIVVSGPPRPLRLCLAFATCLPFACGGVDYCIEDTCISLRDGAQPWTDLGEYLPGMRALTAERYGYGAAQRVFAVDLELYPREHELMLETTIGEIPVECGALWARPVIQAKVIGERTAEGCLPHEFWQHRLPYTLGFGWNDEHSNHWREVDQDLRASVDADSAAGTSSSSPHPLISGL